MEIKVGSFYKTKDGKKVMCVDYDAPHYYFYGNKIVSRDDCTNVISEWTEPRTFYVNVYDGLLEHYGYATKEEADLNAGNTRISCVKIKENQYDE